MLKARFNNPILYIFIGYVNKNLIDQIKNSQRERIGENGIGYVIIDDFSNIDDLIKIEISSHQLEFITQKYFSAGEIKVNYVVNADDETALMLPTIKSCAEYYLQYLYPAGTITDVFAIINDASPPFSVSRNCRNKVLELLLKLQSEGNVIYILSNVNSDNFFSQDNLNNIAHSIALLAVVKDCVPEKRSWYNDSYFIDDCLRCGGNFMTLGHISLEKYYSIFRDAFISRLLSPIRDFDSGLPFEIDLKCGIVEEELSTIEIIMPLVADGNLNENEKRRLTNRQVLDKIFGRRLDLFYEMNFMTENGSDNDVFVERLKNDLEETAKRRDFGFYAVLNLTEQGGELMNFLYNAKKTFEDAGRKQESDLEIFMSAYGYTSVNIKLSFMKIDTYPYELGLRYLRFKSELMINSRIIERIDKAVIAVKNFHKRLIEMKENISGLYNSGVSAIYEIAAIKYINENPDSFLDIYEDMYSYIVAGESEKYIDRLKKYIDDELLPCGIFKRPMPEQMIQDLIDWVEQNRRYNIFLKTGGINLHSGIYILADSKNSLFSVNDADKFGGITFFYEGYGKNIDIFYQTGAFAKEDLYYNDYKNREIRYQQ